MSLRMIRSQKGQIIVEYVLLLVVAVAVAVLLVEGIVSRNQNEPGFLIDRWHKINQTIGGDVTSGNSESDPPGRR